MLDIFRGRVWSDWVDRVDWVDWVDGVDGVDRHGRTHTDTRTHGHGRTYRGIAATKGLGPAGSGLGV